MNMRDTFVWVCDIPVKDCLNEIGDNALMDEVTARGLLDSVAHEQEMDTLFEWARDLGPDIVPVNIRDILHSLTGRTL